MSFAGFCAGRGAVEDTAWKTKSITGLSAGYGHESG
jgi:hypothetical protein